MSVDKCLQCKSKHAQEHDGHGLYAETFNKNTPAGNRVMTAIRTVYGR